MNYVDSLKMGGVDAFQNPSIKGKGAPTTATEGAVGCMYMDTDTGNLYKCIAAADGVYTWEEFGGTVKTVNGIAPDENGNVEIETGGGSADSADNYAVVVEEHTGRVVLKNAEETEQVVEYLGLAQTSVSGGKVVITPKTENDYAGGVRIYYKIKAKPGDIIKIQPTEYWTEGQYEYEPVCCMDDYTLINAPGFIAKEGEINYQIPAQFTDTTLVLLGLRSPTKTYSPPKTWGVVDNDFEKAFYVSHSGEISGNTIHEGHYVIVGADGMLKAGEKTIFDKENAKIKAPWVNVAHRGYPNGVRENTIPAFYEALLDSCNMIECDVWMTSDKIPVLFHDYTITGTVNGVETTLSAESSTYAQLSELVLTPDTKYGDVKIAKLEDALKFARYYSVKLMLDTRCNGDSDLEIVVGLVKKYNMQENVLYFPGNSIAPAKKIISLDEKARVIFYYAADMSHIESVTTDPSKIVIAIKHDEITEDAVNVIRNKGYGMWGWSVSATYDKVLSYCPDYIEYTTGTNVTRFLSDYFDTVKFW